MRSYSKKDLVLCILGLVAFIAIAVVATTTLPITTLGSFLLLVLAWGIVATTIGLFIHIVVELTKKS